MDESLFEKLSRVYKTTVPMHMPGHKRNTSLSGESGYLKGLGALTDITEIDGFDNLNDPHGLFLMSMQKAAALWHSEETLFSVNGGTGAILASIYGCLTYGAEVIVSRNCHKSVYDALEIRGAEAIYAVAVQQPKTGIWGAADAAAIELLLEEHKDTRLVVVTSPTYEGIVSDIRHICRVCHEKNVPVLVDEAHGGHFGFGYGFPESAVTCGADIVVQSLHKTLAGLTQTAMLHLNGNLIDRQKIRRAMTIFQSSSPSYILSSSIDGCVRLLENNTAELFQKWRHNLDLFYERVSGLEHFSFLQNEYGTFDRSKIVILSSTSGMTGCELADILRSRYTIELEMAAPAYAIAMTGIGDTWDNLCLLANALIEIDRNCSAQELDFDFPEFTLPEIMLKPSDAEPLAKTAVSLHSAEGQTSGEYVMAYPPGIPLLVPGEKITQQLIRLLDEYQRCGISVKSTFSGLPEQIFTIKS